MKESFGQYIRRKRTEQGLTLTQFGAKVDLDSANLSKIENGKREFDEKRLPLLSKTLNIDIESLRIEYYSDFIAKKIYKSENSKGILEVAEEKVQYLQAKNVKQAKLKL